MTSHIPLQTLKGFRDFLPEQKRKREFVISKIKAVFERFGFDPIETPTLEYAAVLQGKYGTEADQLMYTFEDRGKRMVGLRYDQTVPTARFLSQHQNNLPKYFRRYQIQNVFRAENTQAGRYREFLQCDCDLFGSRDTTADAEILAVFYSVYKALNVPSFSLRVNDRSTLFNTLKPYETDSVDVFSIIQSIDKLDKIQKEGVVQELVSKGLGESQASELIDVLKGTSMSPTLEQIISRAVALGVPREVIEFQPYLARGLDYYTGLIFEGVIPEYGAGSVGGGGRYDNLIQSLGGPEVAAVGFAVGFDRTIEALDSLGLLPDATTSAQALVTIFNEELTPVSLEAAAQLRNAGVNTEVYPASDKIGKQLKYADDKKIPFVIIIGPDEARDGIVSMKNMKSGEEMKGTVEEIVKNIRRNVQ